MQFYKEKKVFIWFHGFFCLDFFKFSGPLWICLPYLWDLPSSKFKIISSLNTGTPEENINKPSSSFKPIFEAVVAEEEESDQSPRPGNGVTDDQGLFIETTTGSNNIKPASIKKSLNKVQTVSEVLEKERFSQGPLVVNDLLKLKKVHELEKQARAKDEDIIDTSNLQSLG